MLTPMQRQGGWVPKLPPGHSGYREQAQRGEAKAARGGGPWPGNFLSPLSCADLRFPGHLPLPGERVAVVQDLVCDPVNR